MSQNITKGTRLHRLIFAKRISGVCRVCGCTWNDPCYNPKYGMCWWWDDKESVCSHCANKRIFNDPDTRHCVRNSMDRLPPYNPGISRE